MCALSALIFVLNEVALENYFYWKFWWYDIMMHGLVGLVLGAGAAWFLERTGYINGMSKKKIIFTSLVTVLIVGVAWEIIEYTNGVFAEEANIVRDTVADIIMDSLGGILGAATLARIFKKEENIITAPLI